ncbi:MAG: helix-turn-helix domain-containing protein, partial [Gammaproteobacteria bacterium]
VRVYPPVSLRLPSAVLPALLKRQLTISRTSAEFMQAYRKDTVVSEILADKRAINARQTKVLAERFHVSPAVFI